MEGMGVYAHFFLYFCLGSNHFATDCRFIFVSKDIEGKLKCVKDPISIVQAHHKLLDQSLFFIHLNINYFIIDTMHKSVTIYLSVLLH